MSFAFRPASRKKSRLRLALDGPAGSGKTFTALRFAFGIAGPNGRVAVINTESGAVEKYKGLAPDGIPWEFFVGELDAGNFSPSAYMDAIQTAGKQGFHVLVVDSLSHAWQGDGGALDQVSRKGGNSYTAWKDVTPQHNRMVESILRSPCHVIVTMRSKMEYVLEEQTNREGRTVQVPRKIGMAPIQRAGMEYEFDVVADLDHTHTLTVSKSRCPDVDGVIVLKPGASFIEPVIAWLNDGSDVDPSIYAVNPEDLRTAVPPPAPPPTDFREEMRRRVAAQKDVVPAAPSPDAPGDLAGTVPETAAVATPEAPATAAAELSAEAPTPTDDFATAEQVDTIERLFGALRTPVETQLQILARKGVDSPNGRPQINRLKFTAAADLIPKLEAMLEAARAEEFGISPQQHEAARTGIAVPEAVSPALDGPPGKKRRGRKPSGHSSSSTASQS